MRARVARFLASGFGRSGMISAAGGGWSIGAAPYRANKAGSDKLAPRPLRLAFFLELRAENPDGENDELAGAIGQSERRYFCSARCAHARSQAGSALREKVTVPLDRACARDT